MPKINLPDVTLISVDTTDDLSGTLRGVYTSMSGINYGASQTDHHTRAD